MSWLSDMKNICVLGLFLTITFTGQPSDAQSSKFRIHVSVSCDDEQTRALLQSWIKRELRSLGDVRISTPDNAHGILSIVAVESHYEATYRKTGGITIGSMFVKKARSGYYHYPDLWVYSHNTTNLESLCKSIVADIDTRHFEIVRELFN